MDAPSSDESRRVVRRNRFARLVVVLLGAVLELGVWQGYGVLLYGVETAYAR